MEIFAWIGGVSLAAASALLIYWLVKHPRQKMGTTTKISPPLIALCALVASSVGFLFAYVFTR